MISLKPKGHPPGDASDTQMDAIADVADNFSLGEVVVTHAQNLCLPHVRQRDLPAVYRVLTKWELATPNIGKLTDSICCPGLDYCNLANARSINIAIELSERFEALDYLEDLGDVSLKISGCINACGHHHVGNIGVLGIDKQGTEAYQLMLGGCESDDASIGKIVGPAFDPDQVIGAIETVLKVYLAQREDAGERFLDFYRRVGMGPFKDALYGDHQEH
jgi:sulfite reductase (NADPH) hemoprotein beta-component